MTAFAAFGGLLVIAASVYFVAEGGWRVPARFRDSGPRSHGTAHIGAAAVQSTWLSSPLAKLWVSEQCIQFRSRVLIPRPLVFRHEDVVHVSVESVSRLGWTRMHLVLRDPSDFRFIFSSREGTSVLDDLRASGWPVVVE